MANFNYSGLDEKVYYAYTALVLDFKIKKQCKMESKEFQRFNDF